MAHQRWIAGLLMGVVSVGAWAADSDGDGVEDSLDAFPAQAEASVDTDADGLPDSLVLANIPLTEDFEAPLSGWVLGGAATRVTTRHYAGTADGGVTTPVAIGTFTRAMASGTVVYHAAAMNSSSLYKLKVDGTQVSSACTDTGVRNGPDIMFYARWFRCVAQLQPGTHSLEWTVRYTLYQNNASYPIYSDIDHIQVSALAADTDDDNDGLPDVMDPLPLQATFNLDAPYKGSGTRESVGTF
jgi:hypothetical protein